MYIVGLSRGRKERKKKAEACVVRKFSERDTACKKKKTRGTVIIWRTTNYTIHAGICREPRAVCHAPWFGAIATRSPDERRRPHEGVDEDVQLGEGGGGGWVLNATFFSR